MTTRARSSHANQLVDRRLRIIEVVQHPIDAASVEAGVGELQLASISKPVLDR